MVLLCFVVLGSPAALATKTTGIPDIRLPLSPMSTINTKPALEDSVQISSPLPNEPSNLVKSPLPILPSKRAFPLVFTLSGGPVWENAGQTQTLFLQQNIEKTYSATNPTNALADGELFIGFQHIWSTQFQGQLGMAVEATSNANLSGNIWDDADPEFNNFLYSYQVHHSHIALKGKLLTNTSVYALKPYLSGSVGVGFNKAYHFNNIPMIFEAIATPNFTPKTTTSFTYTVGIGIQKAILTHWQVGMGYEFADWGQNHLGPASGQTSNEGLAMNHFYTNGLLFNITWIA